MNKTFFIKGELKEYTNDELIEYLFKEKLPEKLPDSLLDSIINSCVASAIAYKHAEFNTAKDANAMRVAASMAHETLLKAVKYRVFEHVDSLILERLELTPKERL